MPHFLSPILVSRTEQLEVKPNFGVNANAEILCREKTMQSPCPIGFRSNGHFLLSKIFYYVSDAKANIGTAKTYRVGSEPNRVERQ
jgi:hypothetical protein